MAVTDLKMGGKYRVVFDGQSTAQLMLAGFRVGGWASAAESVLNSQGYSGVVLSNQQIVADPNDPSGGLAAMDVDLTGATAPTTASTGSVVKDVVLPLAALAAAVVAAIFSPLAGIVLAIAAVVVLLEAPAAPGSPLDPSPNSPLAGWGGKGALLAGVGLLAVLAMRGSGAKA